MTVLTLHRGVRRLLPLAVLCVLLGNLAWADEFTPGRANEQALIKDRYVRFLTGTDAVFEGEIGEQAARLFLQRLRRPIGQAMAFDFALDADKPFRAFPGEPGHEDEKRVYSPLLQQYLLSLAYGYCVDAPGSPYYRNPEVLACYLRCLDYLHGRGIRDGMTFHNNVNRMHMAGAPQPRPGAANLAEMELRMGALCQSVLLMEPYIADTPTFRNARALIRHLEMLGRTSGHVRYYEPYDNPPAFRYRVQSDAIQNYCDTTLVSALVESDPKRRHEMLYEAQQVFTDSLKVIPGWADTIKPDFTGFHHRGIYGNAYTGGFIPQAAFGVYLLRDTDYAVEQQSVANLRNLILTYRLYCQKYAMPFGIRGRMPLNTHQLRTSVFTGVLIYASSLGIDDATMQGVFARLWDEDGIGLDFLFVGGRGKSFRGLYPLEMLKQLIKADPQAEPDPNGFWYKPYGGLALHRRDDWMAAVKGFSKYVWDYENGDPDENVYGQYVSHGMITIFAQGDPVNDEESGYRLDEGWDWYRMPGTTAVHFSVTPQKPLSHRHFSPETFLGGVTCDGRNGVWGMILNQPTFGDGTEIGLKARKSAFFVDDLIVLLGSGISGGDGVHSVETTLFQTFVDASEERRLAVPAERNAGEHCLVDSADNGYYIPDTDALRVFHGEQRSYRPDGRTPSSGNYAVAWFDHGLAPHDAKYEAAILVRGGDVIHRLAEDPGDYYQVVQQTDLLHHVDFPERRMAGLVFFEATKTDHSIVAEADKPCLVMCREMADQCVQLGVVNPDLGFLPPDAPTPEFRFASDNENQYLPSQERPVQLVLHGHWRLLSPADTVEIISTDDRQTILRFNCRHGMPGRVLLTRD